MKLEQKHVGKWIRSTRWDRRMDPIKVLEIGVTNIWAEWKDGTRDSIINTFDDWELADDAPEPKSVIQRVAEILNEHGGSSNSAEWAHQRISALLQYLEEKEAEARK